MYFKKLIHLTSKSAIKTAVLRPQINQIPRFRAFSSSGATQLSQQEMAFAQKFGAEKDLLFDQILDMNSEQVQMECQKHGLPVVDRKIHNVQTLILYLNKQHKELLEEQEVEKMSSQAKEEPPVVAVPKKKQQTEASSNLAKAKKSLSDDLSRIFQSKTQRNNRGPRESQHDEDAAVQDFSIPLQQKDFADYEMAVPLSVFDILRLQNNRIVKLADQKPAKEQTSLDLHDQLMNLYESRYKYDKAELNTQFLQYMQQFENLQPKGMVEYLKEIKFQEALIKLFDLNSYQIQENSPITEALMETHRRNPQISLGQYLSKQEALNAQQQEQIAKGIQKWKSAPISKSELDKMPVSKKLQIIISSQDTVSADQVTNSKLQFFQVFDSLLNDQIRLQNCLSPDEMIALAKVAQRMGANSELQNKLRLAVQHSDLLHYNRDQVLELIEVLNEPSASQNKKGRIDQTIFTKEFFTQITRSLLEAKNIEEMNKAISFLHKISENNSLMYQTLIKSKAFNRLAFQVVKINEMYDVPIQDQINFASAFTYFTNQPTYFLPEIIQNEQEATAVDPQVLRNFAEKIASRANEKVYQFEHLEASNSNYHRDFPPYSEVTFQFINKVNKDIQKFYSKKSEDMVDKNHFQTLCTLFENEKIFKNYFRNSESAIESVEQFLGLAKRTSKSDFDLNEWNQYLGLLAQIKPVAYVSKDDALAAKYEELTETIASDLEQALNKLEEINVDQLLHVNSKILRLLHPDDVKSYFKHSSVPKMCESILKQQGLLPGKKNDNQSSLQNKLTATNPALIFGNIGQLLDVIQHLPDVKSKIDFLEKIPNLRSLMGPDLIKLFEIIQSSYDEMTSNNMQNKFMQDIKKILLISSSNLETVKNIDFKIYERQNQFGEEKEDKVFLQLNKDIETNNRVDRNMILNKVFLLFKSDQQVFADETKMQHTFSPLSALMAEELKTMSHDEVLDCLKILKSDNIQTFSQEFLENLHERYSSPAEIQDLRKKGNQFLIEFADNWPFFLKNQALIDALVVASSSAIVMEQSQSLKILARKNIVHPTLLQKHFQTFIKMNDKESVKIVMNDFLRTCAYIGIHEGFDIQKLTTTFRRIYKQPQQVEDVSSLINLCIILALSGEPYKDYDAKTAAFVDASLDFIEDKFKCYQTLTKEVEMEDGGVQEVQVNYYDSISSQNKVYNKVVARKESPELDAQKMFEIKAVDSVQPFPDKKKIQKQSKQRKAEQESLLAQDSDDSSISEEEDQMKLEEDAVEAGPKSYEIKAQEGKHNEELAYQNSRKKRLNQLDKKARHLILFTNYDQLNFVNLNKIDIIKAWVVLYHFKSKSLDSQLYEEFSSITFRNSSNKSKGHDLFGNFYNTLLQNSYQQGYKVQLSQRCTQTGWPIDLKINSLERPNEEMALYFLLQEEMCQNYQTMQEEPLALQKLMIKHVKNIRGVPVKFVGENEFYQVWNNEKADQDAYCEQIFEMAS